MSTSPDSRRSRSRILMVDANKSGLAARKTFLEEQGIEAQIATQTADALRLLSEAQFDLVVTGHRTGRLNGVELIQQIRQSHPAVPVILLCNDPDALGLTETTTGADLVLTKCANELAHLARGVSRLLSAPRRKPPLPQGAAARRKLRRS